MKDIINKWLISLKKTIWLKTKGVNVYLEHQSAYIFFYTQCNDYKDWKTDMQVRKNDMDAYLMLSIVNSISVIKNNVRKF